MGLSRRGVSNAKTMSSHLLSLLQFFSCRASNVTTMSAYLIVLLQFLSHNQAVHAQSDLCLLCHDGVAGLKRPHHYLDAHGTTCNSKALEMARDMRVGSPQCTSEIMRFQEPCCGAATPPTIQQAATAPPVYNGPTGDYPSCNICKGRSGIGNPAMVINMLYIGVGTCAQYYDYGLAGLIQTHMCDPLQHYAYEPCGCGEFHPSYTRPMQQAPTNTNNNNNNHNNNQGNVNSYNGGDSMQRKEPSGAQNKDHYKQGAANGRGGHGGRKLRRTLKGST